MKHTFAIVLLAVLGTAACTVQAAPAPAPVTVTAAAPAAPATKEPVTEDTSDAYAPELQQAGLEMVWRKMSKSDRDTMCLGYEYAPNVMWKSFNKGAEGAFTRSEFDSFLTEKCF